MRLELTALALLLGASSASAASFDCAKARSPAEHAVCADPRLSDLDSRLGRAYAQAKASAAEDADGRAKVAAMAKVFFSQRQACGAARPCLTGAYVGALWGYETQGSRVSVPAWVNAMAISGGVAPPSRALPTQPGRCTTTQIDEVAPRLEVGAKPKPSDFDSGTGVSFANGVRLVSYDREPKIIASRHGDPAVMCLVSIPQLCPPGDDRGRFYLVTNQRTKGTWTLPDSQHMCGGA